MSEETPDQAPQNTIISVVVVCFCVIVLCVLFSATASNHRRYPVQMKNSSNLRAIDAAMVIFGNSNNDYLPGLSNNGTILTGAAVQAWGNNQSGASFHARLWILLNSQCLGGDLVINPMDADSLKWVAGQNCTSANTSYAGLQISDAVNTINTAAHSGRAAEWRNNANSQAIMFSDRLLVSSDTADSSVQSVWTTTKGSWMGNLVWGDNHAFFEQTNRGFTTRYRATTNTNDNLFITQGTAHASENAMGNTTENAMMVYY